METTILTIAGLGLSGLCLTVMVRQMNKEMAVFISIAVSLILLINTFTHIRSLMEFVSSYFQEISGGPMYFTILIKVLITSYVTDFTAQLCRDAGENSIASKVELAGKMVIFLIASPVILSVMELISDLIPM